MVPFERSIVDDDLQSVNIPMLQFSNGILTDLTKHKTTKTRKERKKTKGPNGTDAPSEKKNVLGTGENRSGYSYKFPLNFTHS